MKLRLVMIGITRAILEQIVPEIRKKIFSQLPFLDALDHHCRHHFRTMPEHRAARIPRSEVWHWN